MTDRPLPDNHECGTITSTAARFVAEIGRDPYKRRPGHTTHTRLQAPQEEQPLSPDTTTIIMGKGKKLITKKKPEAASVDLFAEEEESSDEDLAESQDQNTIDANPDSDVATPPLHSRMVVSTEEEPQDDDLTQIDSQDLRDRAEATESTGNSNKRKRTYHIIPEDKEVSVVDWYREQEFLYNKKMRAYRDRDRKSRAWAEKASTLDVDGEY